ncbi:hypothetical protein [Roseomonas sp. CECT 9278]|uniref:hypothetical protein n=1 Tax=Roseomonas sp. CECT 9278 TaxID=2845823 RepID=UPI001E2F2C37|nr:hypothetical protein [Roseomonas sp. CECT 9278]CAH0300197.1 hypothetical protein ROS9278_04523 [Roseomonas sp. CECT 9278]
MPVVIGAAAIAAAGVAGGLWWWRAVDTPDPPPKPDLPTLAAPAPAPAPIAPRPAEIGPRIATQAEILAHRAEAPTMFRLDANPRIFVADFPNLDRQGAAFNRTAALVEKAGLPRDRVLDDAALAAAIARSGDTPGTYYYGHNYRGRDLERFFALADRDGIALTRDEAWLRDELARIRRLVPAPGEFAIVSVPGLEERVDAAMREAILQHEVGHGHFFADARFAEHVAQVWRDTFTEAERAAFRAFLAREGYDPAIEEVMMNEAMAYLIFTPDPRFFQPVHAGLTDQRADQLRAALRGRAPQ